MKGSSHCRLIVSIVGISLGAVFTGPAKASYFGTGFTYQGRLIKSGAPVTSSPPHCDFTFGLWDDPNPFGGNLLGTQSINGVEVKNGLFTVIVDFGDDAIDGDERWLEIAVQCPGDITSATLPRQELTPVPYSLRTRCVTSNDECTTIGLGDSFMVTDSGGGYLNVHHGYNGHTFGGGNGINGIGYNINWIWNGGAPRFDKPANDLSTWLEFPSGGPAARFRIDDGTTAGNLTSGLQELMTIERDGDVGIGTSNPQSALGDMVTTLKVGTPSTGASLRLEGGATRGFEVHSGTDGNALEFFPTDNTNTDHRLVLTSGGNVGIGTTLPDAKLDLLFDSPTDSSKAAEFEFTGAGASRVDFVRNSAMHGERRFAIIGQNDFASFPYFQLGSTTNHPIGIVTNGVQRMTVAENGNVGIGNSNPQNPLSVGEAPSDAQILSLRVYSNPTSSWKGGAAFGYASASVIMGELSGKPTIGGHNSNLTAWNELIINPGGGNVGIGLTTPAWPLDVQGEVHVGQGPNEALLGGGGLVELSGATPFIDFHFGNDPSDFNTRIINDADGRLELAASTLWATGNVGIGTSSPGRILHARGGAVRFDRPTAEGGAAVILHQYDGGTGVAHKTFNLVNNATSVNNGTFEIRDNGANVVDGGTVRFRINNSGSVDIPGSLSKGGGSFKIDHPLDPANSYLYHSFVESPDMKNIYDGVAELDSHGEAVVELPNWFGALNRDFRYQLTAVGAPAPNLHVAQQVENNRFKIAGGPVGLRVSWQVTGIRQDAWANTNRIPVEESKSPDNRGKYLHPEVFGKTEGFGENYIAPPTMELEQTATVPAHVGGEHEQFVAVTTSGDNQ